MAERDFQMEKVVEIDITNADLISIATNERGLISIDPQIDTEDFSGLYVDLYLTQEEVKNGYVDSNGNYILDSSTSTQLTDLITRVKLDENGEYNGYIQTPMNIEKIYAKIPTFPTFEINVNNGVGSVERFIQDGANDRDPWETSNDKNGWKYVTNTLAKKYNDSVSAWNGGGIFASDHREPNAANGFNIVSYDDKDSIVKVLLDRKNAVTENPELFKKDGAKMELSGDGEVFVTFYYEGAGYRNALGFYAYDGETGNVYPSNRDDFRAKIKESGKIIFPNVSRDGSGGLLTWGDTLSLGEYKAGTKFIFFIVSNGWKTDDDGNAYVRNPDYDVFSTENIFNDEYSGFGVPKGGVEGRYGISHVAIMLENGTTIKIDNYSGDNKDYSDPQQYFNDLQSQYGSTITQYYIKASTNYYDPYSGATVDLSEKGFEVKKNGRVSVDEVKYERDFSSSEYVPTSADTTIGNPSGAKYADVDETIKDYTHVITMKNAVDSNHDGVIDDNEYTIVMGFEDINRTKGNCDHDFEDVVFSVSSNPISAFSGNVERNPIEEVNPDRDGDGVEDTLDEFPDDNKRAFISHYSSKNQQSTLIFEDKWPIEGDMDLNDLVLPINEKKVLDASYKVKDIDMIIEVLASGANYDNGFSFKIDVPESNIESLSINGNAVTPVADGSGTIIDVFSNLKSTLGYAGNGAYYNTQVSDDKEALFSNLDYLGNGDKPWNSSAMNSTDYPSYNVLITFKDSVDAQTLGVAPYNPFMRISSDNSKEVHLPNYPATQRSGISADETYLSNNGLPWAVLIPTRFTKYPLESIRVEDAYTRYEAWKNSNFNENVDWWTDTIGNFNEDYIYQGH
jgi:LruC domain-containing protein